MGRNRLGKYYKKILKKGGTPEAEMIAHLFNPEEFPLDNSKQEQLKRIRAAWSMLLEFRSPADCAILLSQEFDVSERQAYYDVERAKKVYGDVQKGDEQGERAILHQMLLKAFRVALENADATAMVQAVKEIYKVKQLYQADEGNLPNGNAQPHTYVLNISIEGEQKTINIDHINELPEPERKKLIEAVDSTHVDVATMEKMIDGK